MNRRFLAVATTAALLGAPVLAQASPRTLPFTYPYETLPEGAAEVEIYADQTPLRVFEDPGGDPTKGKLWEPYYRLQTELEYGITNRWEIGFYQVFQAEPQDGGDNTLKFDGFKWRVRTRIAEAGELPVDIGLYLELETLHDEWALEEKILLSRQFGKLRALANLWVEQEVTRPFDGSKSGELEFIVNPTAGLTYQVTPVFHPGIEYWGRGMLEPEGEGVDRQNSKVHHFVGPTLHFNFGKLWLSAGLYAHLNDINTPRPGESYGPVWFRSVIGIDL
ncbi:MAG: hypothetical protein JWM74_791 [Myxococcaceae bacterium]|nr:hypothetical protein [Myxococcaceae bacterium]